MENKGDDCDYGSCDGDQEKNLNREKPGIKSEVFISVSQKILVPLLSFSHSIYNEIKCE